MKMDTFKCYCQHENGAGKKNEGGIMCGIVDETTGDVVGEYQKTSYCLNSKWCTGAYHQKYSVQGFEFGRGILCSEGIIENFINFCL